ncbi:MAG: DnaA regulatory inactivator Hda [Burkholderiaceae bacterium]
MTQLLLDLELPVAPTFDNFIVGRNAESLSALRRLTSTPAADASSRCLYLWGESGSGRSHLMQAIADAIETRCIGGAEATPELLRARVDGPGRRVLVVDDVAAMNADAQEALFHAINRVRDDAFGAMVVSGDAPPRDLVLDPARDDLRSRLAWGLVYQLHRLDDDEKDAALVHRAADRRFPLTPEVRRYLLTHFSRDLGSLMRMVDALDRHARENQRIVTVPLIRDFLQRNIVFPTREERVGQRV